MTIREKIKRVNEILKQHEPRNVTVDHKGNAGYMPQAIIDAMNQVFEYGEWGFEEICNTQVESDGKGIKYISRVAVYLYNADGKEIPFTPTAWGEGNQPRGADGDCRKSAQTDALKKALSYFSVGNRAYWGALNKERRSPLKPGGEHERL